MPVLDSVEPMVWHGAAALQFYDGTPTTPLSVTLVLEGKFSWGEPGRAVEEALSRGRRSTSQPPIIIETTDGEIDISISAKVTTYLGDSDTHAYEVLDDTGNAAAWISTSRGNGKTFGILFTALSGQGSAPVNQTLDFKYCRKKSLKINPDDKGMHSFDAGIRCFMNKPEVA